MRKLVTALAVLLLLAGFCPAAFAQVRLNQGDSFAYTFPSLPLVGVRPNTGSLQPTARLSVVGTSLQWEPGDIVRLELFESDLTQVPADVGLITFPLDPGLITGQAAAATWQDRQGAVRITADAGALTLEKVVLESWVPVDASRISYNYYRSEFAPATDTVVLDVERVGTRLRLSWPRGTLLEATDFTGPWTTNQASSPLMVAPGGPRKFYRVRVR